MTLRRYDHAFATWNGFFAGLIVEPIAASANVIGYITGAFAGGRFFGDRLIRSMGMIFDRFDHVFTNGTKLSRNLGSLRARRMLCLVGSFSATGAFVPMSALVCAPDCRVAMTDGVLFRARVAIAAISAGVGGKACFGTSRCFDAIDHVLMLKLGNDLDIQLISARRALSCNGSFLGTAGSFLGRDVIVSVSG